MKGSILDTISFLTVSWDLTLWPIKSMIELRNVVWTLASVEEILQYLNVAPFIIFFFYKVNFRIFLVADSERMKLIFTGDIILRRFEIITCFNLDVYKIVSFFSWLRTCVLMSKKISTLTQTNKNLSAFYAVMMIYFKFTDIERWQKLAITGKWSYLVKNRNKVDSKAQPRKTYRSVRIFLLIASWFLEFKGKS